MISMIFKGALVGSLLFSSVLCAANLERGALLYKSNCIQCQNRNPNLKGSVGPELVDAPLVVMTAKVMTGVYPEKLPAGFVPKRKTKSMRKIPRLQKDIPDIYAWVQSVKKKK